MLPLRINASDTPGLPFGVIMDTIMAFASEATAPGFHQQLLFRAPRNEEVQKQPHRRQQPTP
ncbi:hypothetical protein GCM10009434_29490 [Brevundimonas olei]